MPHSQPIMGTSTVTGKAELSLSTERPASHWTCSHVFLIDCSLSGFPTNSIHPTIPSTMERQNPTNGCASTLSPLSWQAVMTTSKCNTFPWHSTPCLPPSLISYKPTPSILGDSSSANSMKIFATSSPTQVLRMSLELASRN